jgi:hypothetical protein
LAPYIRDSHVLITKPSELGLYVGAGIAVLGLPGIGLLELQNMDYAIRRSGTQYLGDEDHAAQTIAEVAASGRMESVIAEGYRKAPAFGAYEIARVALDLLLDGIRHREDSAADSGSRPMGR